MNTRKENRRQSNRFHLISSNPSLFNKTSKLIFHLYLLNVSMLQKIMTPRDTSEKILLLSY